MNSANELTISFIWFSSLSCLARSLIEFKMSLMYSAMEMVNRYAPTPSETIEATRNELYAINAYCKTMATQ